MIERWALKHWRLWKANRPEILLTGRPFAMANMAARTLHGLPMHSLHLEHTLTGWCTTAGAVSTSQLKRIRKLFMRTQYRCVVPWLAVCLKRVVATKQRARWCVAAALAGFTTSETRTETT